MQREIHNPPTQADVEGASERELPSAPDKTPHASLPSQSPAQRIRCLHEKCLIYCPVLQMSNIVAINPTDDSFEEILTQADHQIQGMSISDLKQVRFTDRERWGMTSTPKRPQIYGPQDLKDIFQIPRGEDVQ